MELAKSGEQSAISPRGANALGLQDCLVELGVQPHSVRCKPVVLWRDSPPISRHVGKRPRKVRKGSPAALCVSPGAPDGRGGGSELVYEHHGTTLSPTSASQLHLGPTV